jgi:hypothetical protein
MNEPVDIFVLVKCQSGVIFVKERMYVVLYMSDSVYSWWLKFIAVSQVDSVYWYTGGSEEHNICPKRWYTNTTPQGRIRL